MEQNNFQIAQLDDSEYASIRQIEAEMRNKLGKDVVLIAWEAK